MTLWGEPLMPVKQTIYIVEDDPTFRDALQVLFDSVGLNTQPFPTAERFLESFDPQESGCLIVDVRLPGMSGIGLQEHLMGRNTRIPIVVITGHADVPLAVRAMRNGAIDYLTKPFHEQTLLDRVQEALNVDTLRMRRQAELADVERRYATLTERERQVMQLVIDGHPNKEVAARLGVSCKTVEQHRAHVMEKMQADSLALLVRLGLALNRSALPVATPADRSVSLPLSA
jgi:two-component system, LuxR family, response regulator FixJ